MPWQLPLEVVGLVIEAATAPSKVLNWRRNDRNGQKRTKQETKKRRTHGWEEPTSCSTNQVRGGRVSPLTPNKKVYVSDAGAASAELRIFPSWGRSDSRLHLALAALRRPPDPSLGMQPHCAFFDFFSGIPLDPHVT
jgi:hypothetical protein